MSINLKKGNSLNLTKKEPGLKRCIIGLGWEQSADKLDLDASVFMVNADGKMPAEDFLVFYNNLKSPDTAVQHFGDNRTGAGDGDDEIIAFNMPSVDERVTEVLVYVTIHEAATRRHNFGKLKNAYIRIMDADRNNLEILRYDLDAENANDTEVLFGKLSKENGEWHFHAVGLGSTVTFENIVNKYI